MNFDYHTYTNVGDREVNEDFVKVFECENLFCLLLADGLGGHGLGDLASKTACETFAKIIKENQQEELKDLLILCYKSANEALLNLQNQKQAKNSIKTTMCAVLINKSENNFIYSHIGDSRIYFYKNNSFVNRTLDQSVPQMLVLSKQIKEKDIRFHPDRSHLLHCLGQEEQEEFVVYSDVLELDYFDTLLMFTDGFWENVSDKEILTEVKNCSKSEEILKNLAERILNPKQTFFSKKTKAKDLDNFTSACMKIS